MQCLWACSLHFINRIPFCLFRSFREKIINLSIAVCSFPKTDWKISSVYIFRLECGTSAVSIFILPFWLFHLCGYKNFPAWNSHHPGIAQAARRTVVLLKCCVIAWSSFLCCVVSHFFHFFSFMLTLFISNSLSCVLLSPSFESKLPVPYLISLSV